MRHSQRARLCAAGLLAVSSIIGGAAQAAAGTPFVPNPSATGGVVFAAGRNGDHAVIDTDGTHYYIDRYDDQGNHLYNTPLLVATAPEVPTGVAIDGFGRYAVLTTMHPNASPGRQAYLTVYNRDGSIHLARTQVNTTASTDVAGNFVAMNRAGQIALNWFQWNAVSKKFEFRVKTLSATGAATSADVLISPSAAGVVVQGMGLDDAGNVAVEWVNIPGGTALPTIQHQRFYNNGTALTAATQVNTVGTTILNSGLGIDGHGDTVVAFMASDTSGNGIYGQRFNNLGAKVGGLFRINDSIAGEQSSPSVGMTEEGAFTAAWISQPTTSSPYAAMMKQYTSAGVPFANEQTIASPATVSAFPTAVLTSPAGVDLLVWGNAGGYVENYTMDTQPAVANASSGVPMANNSATTGQWRYFRIAVPANATTLTIAATGNATGNGDLYAMLGALPSLTNTQYKSTKAGNTETLQITGVPPGDWYVGLYATAAFSGTTLTITAQ